jgi:four helix bundle protein
MRDFRKLQIWQHGLNLVFATYKLTKDFPESEKYGLTSQLNRAAVSVPSNIAEGSSRNSEKDNIRFLEIALGCL